MIIQNIAYFKLSLSRNCKKPLEYTRSNFQLQKFTCLFFHKAMWTNYECHSYYIVLHTCFLVWPNCFLISLYLLQYKNNKMFYQEILPTDSYIITILLCDHTHRRTQYSLKVSSRSTISRISNSVFLLSFLFKLS